MTFISKDQIRQIINNRPAGTSPEGVVAALRTQGHQLEGYQQPRGLLDPVPLSEGPSVGGFLKNVAKSGARLVTNVAKTGLGAATNALETFTPLNEETLSLPGEQEASAIGQAALHPVQAAKAIGGQFMERYSDEGIGKTLYEDPVGALSDVATALGGAGGVAKIAGAGSKAKELSKLSTLADPIANTSRAIGSTVQAGVNAGGKQLGKAAQGLYQSALKPTKAVERKFPDVVKAGLDRGIVVSNGGLEKVSNGIDSINSQIDAALANATSKGVKIATDDVISYLDETKAFFGNAVGGSKFTKELDSLANTFKRERGRYIPVEKAQEVKKATYAILRKAYGELKSAETEGTKALARGLKEEIAKRVKEIGPLNAEESKLIGLETALEDFVRRNGNKEIMGLAGGAGIGAGAAAAGVTGAAQAGITASIVKSIFDNPAVKSQLAIFLNQMAGGAAFSGRTSRILGQFSEILRGGETLTQSPQ